MISSKRSFCCRRQPVGTFFSSNAIARPGFIAVFRERLLLILLLTLQAALQAEDFTYTTNNGTITITGYTGSGGIVSIPRAMNGLTVTVIGDQAFLNKPSLTAITIPDTVTSIGNAVFFGCTGLAGVTIQNGVTNIGDSTFFGCTRLASITIPSSVTDIRPEAFYHCTNLAGVYFQGNVPSVGINAFSTGVKTTIYYLPGSMGWGTTYGGRPTALWNPQAQTSDSNFGVRTNRFGFSITGTTNIPVVVEASSDLTNSNWVSLQNCTLTNGSIYFSDSQWTNYPGRFYRLRSP